MKSIIQMGFLATALIASAMLTSCKKDNTSDTNDQPGDPVNITLQVYQKEVVDSANQFAIELFKPILADVGETKNVMISPFSITSALSMTLNGAADKTFDDIRIALGMNGKTLDEINDTYLKLMTEMVPVDKRVVVEIANSVWVEKRLAVKPPFITALQTWYKSESRSIDVADPQAVATVNGWIADKTHNKITNMLDRLDPDLAMLLINAVYFNGKWRYQFKKTETKEEPFFVSPTAPKTVPMMHQKANMKVVQTNNAAIVEIPYGQGNYTMVVVLPNENMTTNEVATSLNAAQWREWMELLNRNTHEVNLSLPRFKYEFKRLLNDDLTAQGMGIAFTDKANFSNISDQGLMINRVLHQTFIETNEEGSEAAAATVAEMGITSVEPTQPVTVTINRPFLYFIRETSTGTVLFMGRVSDPTMN
ncbi:serpin family protein [Williamwhitmania taraxaci]|uniref:Serpin B n=1 Tax=Williamwhitmania taraxaci TaxID=1640674 RepID=A0A1G6HES9_9BACT|nr:serpin family protein [Williamwhitmania taraxaci]SDB92817.1 serpin B [Williamwhitmania taraxaci]